MRSIMQRQRLASPPLSKGGLGGIALAIHRGRGRTSPNPSSERGGEEKRLAGTTLSEVLVSTLVMSIGVVALATLFPISVLRSIQASQLTNAANLRYNAEAQIKTIPQMLVIGEEWQPAQPYQQYDVVVASPEVRLKTPAAVFVRQTNATSGGAEPQWNFREQGSTQDPSGSGNADWTTVRLKNYVVDPLGFMLVDPNPNFNFRGVGLTNTRGHFGNLNGVPFNQFVNRFPAFGLFKATDSAALNEARAAAACVLPDSWTLQAESLELANLNNANGTIDLQNVDDQELSSSVQVPTSGPDMVPDRIVLLDESGRVSHTRYLTVTPSAAPGGGTRITWGTGKPLPSTFTPVKARVESLERRYSYLLSVRRGTSNSAHTDVVVFFRRAYSVQDEQVYSAIFRKIDRGVDRAPGTSANDNGGATNDYSELGWPNSDDRPRNFVIVQYNSTSEKPFFKKGGFICDANNLRWYRITEVYEDPLATLPGRTMAQRIAAVTPAGFEQDPAAPNADRAVRLTLGEPVVEDSPMGADRMTPTVTSGIQGGAILMRGVVDVFPLKPRQSWEEQ